MANAPPGIDPGMWTALLNWSAAQSSGYASENSSLRPLSEEDRRFLENAFKASDPVKQEKELIKLILVDENASEENRRTKEQAFDELLDYLEDIDMANDVYLLGGLAPISRALTSKYQSIRWRAIECIGVMAQNNPNLCSVMAALNIFASLFRLLSNIVHRRENGSCNEIDEFMEIFKLLGSISSIAKSNDGARNQLIHSRSFIKVLVHTLAYIDEKIAKEEIEFTSDSNHKRVITKLMFLLNNLASGPNNSVFLTNLLELTVTETNTAVGAPVSPMLCLPPAPSTLALSAPPTETAEENNQSVDYHEVVPSNDTTYPSNNEILASNVPKLVCIDSCIDGRLFAANLLLQILQFQSSWVKHLSNIDVVIQNIIALKSDLARDMENKVSVQMLEKIIQILNK